METENLNEKKAEKNIAKKIARFPSAVFNKIRHFDKEKFKAGCRDTVDALQANGKVLFGTVVLALILMFAVCWTVFFATVRRPEQVMVPNVVGKELASALLEMQAKELYPKIQLRYTDNPDDAGKILVQNPDAGAIVKAGRRINLTVSRGVIVDHVGDYVGQNFDDVKINLQTMFTGSTKPLIVLAEPVYKPDTSAAGTVIAQTPAAETPISNPVTVKLVVSSGDNFSNTRIPNIVGMNFSSLLKFLSTSKVVFEFIETDADKAVYNSKDDSVSVVVSQESSEKEYVPNYTHVKAEIALPRGNFSGKVYGLFTANLPNYPYAVDMTLENVGSDGITETVVSMKHNGGKVTIPYFAERGNELVLSVAGKKTVRKTVE
ncbi:MAG: PASTA domain-containing protein [Treponema sp.]|nr:PASTA domain-containing protein [Treponema sp.]